MFFLLKFLNFTKQFGSLRGVVEIFKQRRLFFGDLFWILLSGERLLRSLIFSLETIGFLKYFLCPGWVSKWHFKCHFPHLRFRRCLNPMRNHLLQFTCAVDGFQYPFVTFTLYYDSLFLHPFYTTKIFI